MMHGTLERKKAAAEHLLPREPWMSVPIKDMTAAQRQQLKEFERKAAELTDAAEAARRAAEGERKAAEEDAMAAIGAFNGALRELRLERMRTDAALAIAEQQRLALACALYQVRGLGIHLQKSTVPAVHSTSMRRAHACVLCGPTVNSGLCLNRLGCRQTKRAQSRRQWPPGARRLPAARLLFVRPSWRCVPSLSST